MYTATRTAPTAVRVTRAPTDALVTHRPGAWPPVQGYLAHKKLRFARTLQ